MAKRGDDVPTSRSDQEGTRKIGLVVGALAAVALLAFVFQNTESQKVEWLFWDIEMPLFLLVIITVVLTLVVSVIGAWVLGRRKR